MLRGWAGPVALTLHWRLAVEVQHLNSGVLGVNRCAPECVAALHPHSTGLRAKQVRSRCILTLGAWSLASLPLCFLAGLVEGPREEFKDELRQ